MLLVSLGAARAQDGSIVVTGTREPVAGTRLAADVAVVNSDTLRNTTADSLADVLRRETGVQLSRSGGPGQSTGLLIRGAASQQNVLLVDGVRIGSATLGFAAFEALGLSQAERVEVLRGPGSSLFGADAVGGVVQVFTKTGTPGVQAEGHAAVGGLGGREFSAGVRGASGPFDFAVGAATERSRGVSALRPGDPYGNYNPDADGYQLDSAQARLGFKPAPGHRVGLLLLSTRLNSQYDASEFLPPSFAQDASPDFRTRLHTDVQSLDWRGTLAAGLVGSARASHSVDDARNGGTQTDRFRTTREQLSAQLAWQAGALGQLVGALEQGRDRATSTSYLAPVQRRTEAAVAELTGSQGEQGPWAWQADLRQDHSSDYGNVGSGRLGGSVQLMPGLRLRALAGNTFRAPSFNDLYFPGYGVPTLRPEKGRSAELGLNWKGAGGQASATLFSNRVRDLIGYEGDNTRCPADPQYSFGCAANVSRAKLQGASFNATQQFGAVKLRAQLDLLRARDADSGERLARRADRQASLGAEWALAAWTLGADALYLGTRPDGGKTLAAETTLNLFAAWRPAPAFTLQARLNNATDRNTEPANGYQGLPRVAWLVLRYEGQP